RDELQIRYPVAVGVDLVADARMIRGPRPVRHANPDGPGRMRAEVERAARERMTALTDPVEVVVGVDLPPDRRRIDDVLRRREGDVVAPRAAARMLGRRNPDGAGRLAVEGERGRPPERENGQDRGNGNGHHATPLDLTHPSMLVPSGGRSDGTPPARVHRVEWRAGSMPRTEACFPGLTSEKSKDILRFSGGPTGRAR